MFGFSKRKNDSVLRQMDGREIKYVTRRIKLPDGNVKEEILGKTGRMVAINGEIRVMCGEKDVFRCAAEDAVYFDLMSGAGVTISGVNELDNEQMDIIVYYTYHRK
ncbi:MAG: hypothetical protein IKL62_04825 [Clostridia bacterium]|nr:hypothetical protein [Clostridia bacterium]